jgi:hypothetical protein
MGHAIMTRTPPTGNDYKSFLTIGVGVQSAVRLWHLDNNKLSQAQPKNYEPLEWNEVELIESTRNIQWYITIGNKKGEKKNKIQMEEDFYSELEKLSVSTA